VGFLVRTVWIVGVVAACGCAARALPEPAVAAPDRRTVVEEHATTQAPGSPLTNDEQSPVPVTPPPAADAE
jgi:hypothetical protein